ncbi:DUF1674 domain-containing protein [Parvularcula dongshanensis]|uniref:DUF1674 domain-containing protein n=1 Tax=Parvularcula dongshanensis TaxID=1173995 RepID=A0A840I035_9PROT|nr:DUF1674 domain-containing protein [Parvularcula dongshanensis]MBB4658047.1 hypothetical protein [Parvularcula dongshanensis]
MEQDTPDDAALTTEDGIPLFANGQRLSDAQIQALREARERRAAIDAASDLPPERGGPNRKEEPTRYGDWEKSGRAYDFS